MKKSKASLKDVVKINSNPDPDSVEAVFGDKSSSVVTQSEFTDLSSAMANTVPDRDKQLALAVPVEVDITFADKIPDLIVRRSNRCTICRDDQLFNMVNFLGMKGDSYSLIIDKVKKALPDSEGAQRLTQSLLSRHFEFHFMATTYRAMMLRRHPELCDNKTYAIEPVNETTMQAILRSGMADMDFIRQQRAIMKLKAQRLNELYEEKSNKEEGMFTQGEEVGAPPPDFLSKDWLLLHKLIEEVENSISDISNEIEKRTKDANHIDILRVQNLAVKLSDLIDNFIAENKIDDVKKDRLKETIARLFNELTSF